jgi:hypothetical protein
LTYLPRQTSTKTPVIFTARDNEKVNSATKSFFSEIMMGRSKTKIVATANSEPDLCDLSMEEEPFSNKKRNPNLSHEIVSPPKTTTFRHKIYNDSNNKQNHN